jgi:hypothetical protein
MIDKPHKRAIAKLLMESCIAMTPFRCSCLRVRAPQPEDLTRVLEASVRENDPPILAGRLTPLPIGPVRESRLPRDRATRRLSRELPDKAQQQAYARDSLVRLSAPNSG